MVVSAESREQLLLDRLRERYERDGYSFHAYPPREFLPSFLGGYRPDAIALQGTGGVVVEIKGRTAHGDIRLSELAGRFTGQHDWRLEVVSLDDAESPLEIEAYPRSLIEGQLEEVNRLVRQGSFRAAFAVGWAALEAAARALLAGSGEGTLALRYPTQIAEILARNGFVDQQTAKTLMNLVQIRNAVVHGNLSQDVGQANVAVLTEITSRLIDQLDDHPVAPEQRV